MGLVNSVPGNTVSLPLALSIYNKQKKNVVDHSRKRRGKRCDEIELATLGNVTKSYRFDYHNRPSHVISCMSPMTSTAGRLHRS